MSRLGLELKVDVRRILPDHVQTNQPLLETLSQTALLNHLSNMLSRPGLVIMCLLLKRRKVPYQKRVGGREIVEIALRSMLSS